MNDTKKHDSSWDGGATRSSWKGKTGNGGNVTGFSGSRHIFLSPLMCNEKTILMTPASRRKFGVNRSYWGRK